jgi:hypothetical protein
MQLTDKLNRRCYSVFNLRWKHAAWNSMLIFHCVAKKGMAGGGLLSCGIVSLYFNRTSLLITVKQEYKHTIFYKYC